MKSNTTTKLILISAVLALSIYLLYPTYKYNNLTEDERNEFRIRDQKAFYDLKDKAINLGLDLQGGMHVVLEVDIRELLKNLASNMNKEFEQALIEADQQVQKSDEDFISVFNGRLKAKGQNIVRYYASADLRDESNVLAYLRDQSTEAVDRSLEILRNRVDEFGVSEPIIQKQGDRRIIVELAGVTDPTRVRKLIGKTALLEFKMLRENIVTGQIAEKINAFIKSKSETVPADSAVAETATDSSEQVKSVGELLNIDTTKAVDAATESASIFEENIFFLDPRDQQTLLVPVQKEEKFKEILKLPEVKQIIAEQAGSAEFLWGAKPELNEQYYQVFLVNKNIELTGSTITEAVPQPGSQSDPNSIGKFEISLSLNDEGSKVFARVTGANIGKRLAIILDNKVFLAPTLQVKITGGRARITNIESMQEASDLAIVLKAGALPAPVQIMEERTVGPSLGQDSINAGSYSALLGLVLVALFMMVYYRVSGLVADLALLLNIVLIMSIIAYFHATLTLPGIAGIILTIGMAVDANVLILERVREEIRRGKTVRNAIEVGYGKALITILDANVTTFIAGLVLYTYGSGPIQGFALTLMIGIVASMFTAIVVTRVIFDFSLERMTVKKLSI